MAPRFLFALFFLTTSLGWSFQAQAKEPVSFAKSSIPVKKEVLRLEAHNDHVRSVAISPDSTLVATGGEDSLVKLWDLASGKQIRTFSGHSNWVSSLLFVPQTKLLISGSYDRTIRIWELETGKEVACLEGTPSLITSLALDGTGNTLAVGSHNGMISLWNIPKAKLVSRFQAQAETVASLTFTSNGQFLVFGGGEQTDFDVKVWNLEQNALVQRLVGHSDIVTSVGYSPHSNTVVTSSLDGSLRTWDFRTGKPVGQVSFEGWEVVSGQLQQDGKTLLASCRPASGSQSCIQLLVDLKTGKPTCRMSGGESDFGFATSGTPNGKYVVSGDSNSYSLHVWKLN
ncbi:MAG: WD40 repeat domain-containing protein [Blastocatellia bacterium]|nr:WD40 repeat domain-containing protein [Blastocatellia bacterium]